MNLKTTTFKQGVCSRINIIGQINMHIKPPFIKFLVSPDIGFVKGNYKIWILIKLMFNKYLCLLHNINSRP